MSNFAYFSSADDSETPVYCEDDPGACPQCAGIPGLVGCLGSLIHFRCVHCGWMWAERILDKAAAGQD